MLAKYLSSKRSEWSTDLDNCVFTYNTSQPNILYTLYLMFRHHATLPIDVEMENEPAGEKYSGLPDTDFAVVKRAHCK